MTNNLVFVLTCDLETTPGEIITGVVVGVTRSSKVAHTWATSKKYDKAMRNREYHCCFIGCVDSAILKEGGD